LAHFYHFPGVHGFYGDSYHPEKNGERKEHGSQTANR
jgi:hypothetical protein